MSINYIYAVSFLLAILSFYFFENSKIKLSLLLLFLAAICIRFFLIYTDNFLHDWDERYHALVAKNLINYPFKPMLRVEAVLKYDYTAWCCNHIWLHKQPLFLWQMAISMKVFGVNTFALRLPSAIMGALLVFPTYKIGKSVFNSNVGYYAAFLLVFAYYQIQLITGAMGMDHNDISFLFYITLSIWAYFMYVDSPKLIWVLAIGVFAGAAILCKWLTGLLVYSGWFLNIVINYKTINIKKQIEDLLKSVLVAVLVFLPWQIYTSLFFPKESTYERNYNTRHVFEVIEGHTGSLFFYLKNLNLYYSEALLLFIVIGMILIFNHFSVKKILILSYIFIIFFFFSIIVKTKLPTYVYVVSPLVYLLIGNTIDSFFGNQIKNRIKTISILIILITCSIFTLQPKKLSESHFENAQIEIKKNNANIYKKINSLVPSGYIVFNCKALEDPEAMFFSDRNVYQWYMTEEEYKDLKIRGIKIAAFKNHTNQQLPSYLQEDKEVLIINEELK
jgi:4-amino-4-deoxy-L-arabinose transferase-like glycosyltransferase